MSENGCMNRENGAENGAMNRENGAMGKVILKLYMSSHTLGIDSIVVPFLWCMNLWVTLEMH